MSQNAACGPFFMSRQSHSLQLRSIDEVATLSPRKVELPERLIPRVLNGPRHGAEARLRDDEVRAPEPPCVVHRRSNRRKRRGGPLAT